MGFRQKSRGIRLGRWEYLLLLLVCVTLASALSWWYSRNTVRWERTYGRVVGVSLVENRHQIDASRPQLRIHYEYTAGTRTYKGKKALDTLTRTVYRAVPQDVIQLLREKGYMSFNDLPPRVRQALQHRGIERLDAVPESLMETLRAQGIRSVRDFPQDMQERAKEGDYRGAIRKGADLLGASKEPDTTAKAKNGTPPSPTPAGRDAVAPLPEGALIPINYDPGNPQRHRVRGVLAPGAALLPILTGIFALLTVVYCGLFYPWVKQR